MILKVVKFQKHSKKSKWENGLYFERPEQISDLILDSAGNILSSVYDIKDKITRIDIDNLIKE